MATAPAASNALPVTGGAFFQVSPSSNHGAEVPAKLFETVNTEPPLGPASLTRRRSVALWTAPVIPDRLNFRYERNVWLPLRTLSSAVEPKLDDVLVDFT